MPSLVEEMSEGVISRWLKRPGDYVEHDDELLEIDTDKVTVAYAAPYSGYLEIVAAEGSTVAVGDVIARLASEPLADGHPEVASPAVPSDASSLVSAETTASKTSPDDVLVTPLARQLAEQHSLDLTTLQGSGPRGRVTRNDVASRLGLPTSPRAASQVESDPRVVGTGEDMSRLQRTVARRMVESHTVVPDFQVETEVHMDALVALRDELKFLDADRVVPSMNDFLVKACASALREHPRVNASFDGDRILLNPAVNIGIAVAADDVLIVPTVTDADERSLTEIAIQTRGLAERGRHGTLTREDMARATFTISNLGMYGMTAITPIVNLPQVAILGVGAIRDTLALDHGEVVVRRLMTLRLSCDHRILYGADAARFLSSVREQLERPLLLLT